MPVGPAPDARAWKTIRAGADGSDHGAIYWQARSDCSMVAGPATRSRIPSILISGSPRVRSSWLAPGRAWRARTRRSELLELGLEQHDATLQVLEVCAESEPGRDALLELHQLPLLRRMARVFLVACGDATGEQDEDGCRLEMSHHSTKVYLRVGERCERRIGEPVVRRGQRADPGELGMAPAGGPADPMTPTALDDTSATSPEVASALDAPDMIAGYPVSEQIGHGGMAGWIAMRSREPDGYQMRHMTGPWSYPRDEVIGSTVIISIELFLAVLVLWRTHAVSGASLILSIGFGVMFVGGLAFAMHAPTFIAGSVMHLFFAACWLLAAAVVTKIIALVVGTRRGPYSTTTRPAR